MESLESHQKVELAELFNRAFGKRTISVNRGGAKVCRDGTLSGIEYISAKEWLEEEAAKEEAKRREAAKRAAITRARRREFTLYKLVKRYLETGMFTPAANCECCGRGLSDPESERRGIGSECWGRFLKSVDKAKTHGAPVNEWDVTIDEIMGETPRRENARRCPICDRHTNWRSTDGGKALCSS